MENSEPPAPFVYAPRNAVIPPLESHHASNRIEEIPASEPSEPDRQDEATQGNVKVESSEDRMRAFVQWMHFGFPARTITAVMEHFDFDPERALDASTRELDEVKGFTGRQAAKLRDSSSKIVPAQMEWLQRGDIRLITIRDDEYPAELRTIPDPPALLMVWGQPLPPDQPVIGIVGSRKATPYGFSVSERFAKELCERGCAIASGGAAGIDTAAHRGALKAGGATYAFLGCGIDYDYPRENRELFARMRERGALYSEYAPGSPPDAWRFPPRNRLISGVSHAIVVVEAPLRSGALITANYAGEQGKSVLAVPGNIDRISSGGTNELIRTGATMALSIDDILHAAGLITVPSREAPQQFSLDDAEDFETAKKPSSASPAPEPEKDLSHLSDSQMELFLLLDETPKLIDSLGAETGLPIAQLGVELTLLELYGLIQRLPGNRYIRV